MRGVRRNFTETFGTATMAVFFLIRPHNPLRTSSELNIFVPATIVEPSNIPVFTVFGHT